MAASHASWFDPVWPTAPLGWLHTYASGTTTPKQTWKDAAKTLTHALPTAGVPASGIQLDADGRVPTGLFLEGSYTLHVYTSAGVQVSVRNNVTGVADAASETDAALRADLADTAAATKAAGQVGYSPGLPYASGVGEFLNRIYARTAREIAAGVIPTNYAYVQGDIRRYGADPTGAADSAAAIDAADRVACAGAVGFDGVTVLADGVVWFPPGIYRANSELTYRGAPWRGAGIANTKIKFYGSSGPLVNAEGTPSARKLLSISDMSLDGGAATGTAYGVRIGHNYRSFGALSRVRIDYFPGPGIVFAADCWNMSFIDTYLSFNAADSLGSGIYIDSAVTGLLAIDWFNLQLENNGFIGSGVAGGMELPNSFIQNWNFYGGVWEGNYGDCEVRFTNCGGVHVYGAYMESEAASVTDGIVFAGNTVGSVYGLFNVAGAGMTGKGIRVAGTANVTIDQVRSDDQWPVDLSVEGTAIANLVGDGFAMGAITVSPGAALKRAVQKRVQLTDAATIALDASKGTSFHVTLGGNRTLDTPTNSSVGQRITLTVYQDGVGGRTLAFSGTWNSSWSNTGNAASRRSCAEFEYDGTYWNQVSAQSPYV